MNTRAHKPRVQTAFRFSAISDGTNLLRDAAMYESIRAYMREGSVRWHARDMGETYVPQTYTFRNGF